VNCLLPIEAKTVPPTKASAATLPLTVSSELPLAEEAAELEATLLELDDSELELIEELLLDELRLERLDELEELLDDDDKVKLDPALEATITSTLEALAEDCGVDVAALVAALLLDTADALDFAVLLVMADDARLDEETLVVLSELTAAEEGGGGLGLVSLPPPPPPHPPNAKTTLKIIPPWIENILFILLPLKS
jgi:hypothetical protein